MDIKIQLERSEYIKQRAYFMKTLEVPTISEAKGTLGKPLAEIVFVECEDALQVNFGLIPPLHGAGDELWVSPSDLLIGKVVLKPPLTSKHIQALTHQGILDIGQEIEVKYWNEMELEKERALAEQKKLLQEEFDEILRDTIRDVEFRERAACKKELERLTAEFEETLIEELNNLECRLREEFEEYSRQQEEMLRQEWEKKLKEEVEKTVRNMTREFLKELERQEAIMTNNLKIELQKRDIQRVYDIKMERTHCKDSIKQLKHNLECKNIANMMYVLCMERRKCCEEKMDIEKYYKGEMQKLNNIIKEKDQQIKDITDEKNQKIKELNLRETCILEILKQFQKFINFALRAAPTQAEFLLSIEKMMVFELAETILKTDFMHLRPCNQILPWLPAASIHKEIKPSGLFIKDHHDCFNEIDIPRPDGEELGPDDFLPAFSYKDKLYVREDFRNMLSQGIEMSPSNELWSKDVEILINTLKASVSEIQPEGTSVHAEEQSKKNSTQSSIHFKLGDTHRDTVKRVSLDEKGSINTKKSSLDRKASYKPCSDVLEAIDFSQVGNVEKHPALIATANSLELIIKRGSIKQLKDKDESELDEDVKDEGEPEEEIDDSSAIKQSAESFRIIKTTETDQPDAISYAFDDKEPTGSKQPSGRFSTAKYSKTSLIMNAKDSIILRKTSLLKKSTEFNITPRDSIEIQKESKFELGKKSSKLVAAKSSVEMLRESKMKLRDPIPCPKKEPSKIKSTTSYLLKQPCCDKCMKGKDSSEILDGLIKTSRRSKDSDKSIKVSHVEVINVEDEKRDSNVAFNISPVVYDIGNTKLDNLSNIYKIPEKRRKKKPIDKFLSQPQVVKVLGDSGAKEHLQDRDQFTVDRIRSFISLIKDHPNLIRTFTACTR